MLQPAVSLPYQYLKLPHFPPIAFLDEGPETAPVLLFLHGLGDDAAIWWLTIKAFSARYRCIALDLPGHGKTPAGQFGFRMFDFANLTESFLQALNISRFSLIGHSMGGQISIILSLRIPARIEKLVLVATAGFEQFSPSEVKMLQAGAGFSTFSGNGAPTAKSTRQNALTRCISAMLEEPVFDFLPQITVPSLIVFGEQDGFIPNRFLHSQSTAQVARAGASRIPNSELLLIPRCNHYPQLQKQQLFNEALNKFVRLG